MENLYPLKFIPILKEKIWGGDKIENLLHKDIGSLPNCGESWEISAVEDNISVVSNGFLAGNTIEELIEVYMGDLVGDRVFDQFGVEFPLLVKFIDANDDLSVQVHPGDEMARKRHNANGKTEMWYVLDADPGSKLQSGFNQVMTPEIYNQKLGNSEIMDILNFEEVNAGDVFFIPAGRVHALMKGILLTEIQQTSDITYRIYDYNRPGMDGNLRELHSELAVDAIDYQYYPEIKTDYKSKLNEKVELVNCKYFTTNLIEFDAPFERDYNLIDSFVIYICIEGDFQIETISGIEKAQKGETILLPASLEFARLVPVSKVIKVLEVYIPE